MLVSPLNSYQASFSVGADEVSFSEWEGRAVAVREVGVKVREVNDAAFFAREISVFGNSNNKDKKNDGPSGSISGGAKVDSEGNARVKGDISIRSPEGNVSASAGGSISRDKDGKTKSEGHIEVDCRF